MKTDLKEKITQTAIELFRKKRYNNVTVNELCQQVGITKKTLYYHFDSKESIVDYYYRNLYRTTEQILNDIKNIPNLPEKLWHIFECFYYKADLLGSDLYKVHVHHLLNTKELTITPFSILHNQHPGIIYSTSIEIVNMAQIQNIFRTDASAEILLWTFTSAMTGASVSWAAHEGEVNELDGIKQMFNLIFYSNTNLSQIK